MAAITGPLLPLPVPLSFLPRFVYLWFTAIAYPTLMWIVYRKCAQHAKSSIKGEVGIVSHLTDSATIRSRCGPRYWCRCWCRCRDYINLYIHTFVCTYMLGLGQLFCLQLEHVCFGWGSCWPLAVNLQPATAAESAITTPSERCQNCIYGVLCFHFSYFSEKGL